MSAERRPLPLLAAAVLFVVLVGTAAGVTLWRFSLALPAAGPNTVGEAGKVFYAERFQHIPANQLALNKLLVNQAFENMGLRTTQLLGTFFDGVTRHTEEAYRWAESFSEKGFREVIRERDAPFGDYGERKR